MIFRLSVDTPPQIGMVGHISYRAGRVRQNCHPKNIFVYLRKGSMRYEPLGGDRVMITAGMHLIIPAGQSYRLIMGEEQCDYYYAHFVLNRPITLCDHTEVSAHLAQKAMLQQQVRVGHYPAFAQDVLYVASHGMHDTDSRIPYHLSRCEELRYGSAALDHYRLSHRFFEVLLSIAASLENELPSMERLSPLLTKIIRYIKDGYTTDITLAQLSLQFRVSKQYIMRLFRECLGTTVTHFVTDLRLRKSAELLIHTSLSVSEVAYAVGYEDPHYFDRLFKKAYGITPTQFQKTQAP